MKAPGKWLMAGISGGFLLGVGYVLAQAGAPRAAPALRKVASVELPGGAGKRFDYLTVDYRHGYLVAAHLGANVTYLLDLKTNRVVQTIAGTPGAEGVAYAPDVNKLYTSNWGDHTIGVVDMATGKVIKKIPALNKPDGSTYAAPFHKLYVSDERGKALLVVDVRTDKVVHSFPFTGETGMPRYDSLARKVYLNLQESNQFVVVDPATDRVEGTYPVGGGCRGNHGMALDPPHHLAFLVCEDNDQLTVFNVLTHRAVAHVPLPSGGDVVKYDPGLKRVYVACSSGFIAVVQQQDPTHFVKVQDVPVPAKVHSLAVDVRTHRVYAPEQEAGGRPVARMTVYEAGP